MGYWKELVVILNVLAIWEFYVSTVELEGLRLWTQRNQIPQSESLKTTTRVTNCHLAALAHQAYSSTIVSFFADTKYFSFISLPLSLPAKTPTRFKSMQPSKPWLLVSQRGFREKQSWLRVRTGGQPVKGKNVWVLRTAGAWEGEKQLGEWGKNVHVTSRGKKVRLLPCLCQQVFVGKGRVVLMAGDFWFGFYGISHVYFTFFKAWINVQIQHYNYSESSLCFYWIWVLFHTVIFKNAAPGPYFETLLAFLAY